MVECYEVGRALLPTTGFSYLPQPLALSNPEDYSMEVTESNEPLTVGSLIEWLSILNEDQLVSFTAGNSAHECIKLSEPIGE